MGNIKILVVEDIIINRLVIRQYFQNHHHIQVHEASNGREAVSKIKSERYDVVLMDIRMPMMDGVEATSIIRALEVPALRNIPIIALTANATDDFADEQQDTYFTDVVIKPFNAHELRDKVMQCIGLDHTSYIRQKKNYTRQDYAVIDYEKVEKPFDHDKASIIQFYQVVEQSLEEYKSALTNAIIRNDADGVENIIHKAELTLSTLFFEELQAVLYSMPLVMNENLRGDNLQELIRQTNHQFDEAISVVRQRRHYIMKNGL